MDGTSLVEPRAAIINCSCYLNNLSVSMAVVLVAMVDDALFSVGFGSYSFNLSCYLDLLRQLTGARISFVRVIWISWFSQANFAEYLMNYEFLWSLFEFFCLLLPRSSQNLLFFYVDPWFHSELCYITVWNTIISFCLSSFPSSCSWP